MASSNVKNQMERSRYRVMMAAIQREEKLWNVQCTRELRYMRSELISMLAYRKVYRDYSFYRIQEKVLQDLERERRANTTGRVTFQNTALPPDMVQTARIARAPSMADIPTSRSDGELYDAHSKTIQDLGHELNALNICDAPGNKAYDLLVVDADYNQQHGAHNDKDISHSKGNHGVMEERTIDKQKNGMSQRRNANTYMYGASNFAPQKSKPSLFPADCRNTFTMRRFMDGKAETLIKHWSPEQKRKREVQKILAKISFPKIVERQKTTSAIFRDFRQTREKRRLRKLPSCSLHSREAPTKSIRITHTRDASLRLPPMSQDEKLNLLDKGATSREITRSKTMA